MPSSQKMKHFECGVKVNQPWTPVRLFKTIKLVVCRHPNDEFAKKKKSKSNSAFQNFCLFFCFQISLITVSPRARHTEVIQSINIDNDDRVWFILQVSSPISFQILPHKCVILIDSIQHLYILKQKPVKICGNFFNIFKDVSFLQTVILVVTSFKKDLDFLPS